MSKFSPKIIALIEATGLLFYILSFVTLVTNIGPIEKDILPAMGFAAFLLAFVFSALVCATIVLGYPLFLALKGRLDVSVRIVLWCIVWLAVFGLLFLIYIFALMPSYESAFFTPIGK